jgi:hypothetical protein
MNMVMTKKVATLIPYLLIPFIYQRNNKSWKIWILSDGDRDGGSHTRMNLVLYNQKNDD